VPGRAVRLVARAALCRSLREVGREAPGLGGLSVRRILLVLSDPPAGRDHLPDSGRAAGLAGAAQVCAADGRDARGLPGDVSGLRAHLVHRRDPQWSAREVRPRPAWSWFAGILGTGRPDYFLGWR